MNEEFNLPPFEPVVTGQVSFVIEGRDTDNPTITIRDTFTCQYNSPYPRELKGSMELTPDVSAKLLADGQLEQWANKIREKFGSILREQLIIAAHNSWATTVKAAAKGGGLATVDIAKEIDIHTRVVGRSLKARVAAPRPGHPKTVITHEDIFAALDALRKAGRNINQLDVCGELGCSDGTLRDATIKAGYKKWPDLKRDYRAKKKA